MAQPFVWCDNLVKIYRIADVEVQALQGLDLQVERGEMMALVGASGSGKSSLLNVIGGLDEPTAGRVSIDGVELQKLDEKGRVAYKRDTVGFVWQQPARNLLPYLSARENVELPMTLGKRGSGRKQRALDLLDMVGLADRADFRPDRLSGGQQQRVALAVALANNPPLLLGDEPTGQVDHDTAVMLFDALRTINREFGTTILLVTHDQRVANRVDRVVAIQDGRTSTEIRRDRSLADGSVQEEEWVILDRAGRLQMPKAYVQKLEMRDRVRLHLENDHVSVWPGAEQGTKEAGEQGSKGAGSSALVPSSAEGGEGLGSETETTYWRPKPVVFDDQPAALPAHNGSNGNAAPAVVVDGVSRAFEMGSETVLALDGVSLTIPAGTVAVLKGPSGSGKTTLLNLIAGLDEPTRGRVIANGRDLATLSADEKIDLRRRSIGFVFQTFGLVPFLTARENVEVPLRLVMTEPRERAARVEEVLAQVGLTARGSHRVYELSGGEQQRVALARALANRPALLLADEPTGQLDTATGHDIIDLIRRIVLETGVTAVIASHDPKVEAAADEVTVLQDGQLVESSNGT